MGGINNMKIDKMGVMVIVSHLIISLVILVIYGYTLYKGMPDETLKTILTVIIGYWFGSVGMDKIRPASGATTQIQANEVKMMPEEKNKEVQ